MAKPKGSKFKKQTNKRKKGEPKSHPRGGGFGFDKTKALKELVGSTPSHSAPIRSKLLNSHSSEEQVYVVSSGSILDEKPQLATFDQLSKLSITQLTTTTLPKLEEPEEELGFFFDSTPNLNDLPVLKQPSILSKPSTLSNYEQKKQKILQDDSIHIDSEDDDDDISSISSSEDISMLDALSHWGKNDILQFEEPVKRNNDDFYDYAMLEDATLDDICISDQEFGLDEDEEDSILLDDGMSFDLLENVPDSLKNSYKSIMQQEKNRVKKQAKKQRNLKQRMQMTQLDNSSKGKKKNLLDQILNEFIKKNYITTYKLSNLTYHGHSVVVPKIAKLFQLEVLRSGSNKKTITLSKTSKTCIPESYKQHIKVSTHTTSKFKNKSKPPNRTPIRDNDHGKLVASDSVPISSSNIGHRMLAAMGWKQGDAIGNNEDGIKEPVQVFMRAKRRGLGA